MVAKAFKTLVISWRGQQPSNRKPRKDGSYTVFGMSTDKQKKSNVFLCVSIAGVLLILLICISIWMHTENKFYKGAIFVNGEKVDATALISKRDVLVPMIPLLEEYGYDFEYQSEAKFIMKKGVYMYHIDLTELTIYEVEKNESDLPPVHDSQLNLLLPAAGDTTWVIRREGNDIIMDHITMLSLLNTLQEKQRLRVSYEDKKIEYLDRID